MAQHTNWRGDPVEQNWRRAVSTSVPSAPPDDAGKIERSEVAVGGVFCSGRSFDKLRGAVERTALVVQVLQPQAGRNQGSGIVPRGPLLRDRTELRQTIEKGLEENALELALRGRPVDPFYMVGRMRGQSVVIRAEKGKVRMLVTARAVLAKKNLSTIRERI